MDGNDLRNARMKRKSILQEKREKKKCYDQGDEGIMFLRLCFYCCAYYIVCIMFHIYTIYSSILIY